MRSTLIAVMILVIGASNALAGPVGDVRNRIMGRLAHRPHLLGHRLTGLTPLQFGCPGVPAAAAPVVPKSIPLPMPVDVKPAAPAPIPKTVVQAPAAGPASACGQNGCACAGVERHSIFRLGIFRRH